jgi:hypothetical protein
MPDRKRAFIGQDRLARERGRPQTVALGASPLRALRPAATGGGGSTNRIDARKLPKHQTGKGARTYQRASLRLAIRYCGTAGGQSNGEGLSMCRRSSSPTTCSRRPESNH